MNAEDILGKALSFQVAFVFGASFCNDAHGTHALRLNYSYPGPDQIETGIQRLGEVLAKAIETSER
jgi:DNA-binding transcriptional MocR family regulator